MGNISTDKKLALFHGFLYEDGLLTQFDYQGAATTEVFDVNAREATSWVASTTTAGASFTDTSVARITRGT